MSNDYLLLFIRYEHFHPKYINSLHPKSFTIYLQVICRFIYKLFTNLFTSYLQVYLQVIHKFIYKFIYKFICKFIYKLFTNLFTSLFTSSFTSLFTSYSQVNLTLYLQSSPPDTMRSLEAFQSMARMIPSWAFHC